MVVGLEKRSQIQRLGGEKYFIHKNIIRSDNSVESKRKTRIEMGNRKRNQEVRDETDRGYRHNERREIKIQQSNSWLQDENPNRHHFK